MGVLDAKAEEMLLLEPVADLSRCTLGDEGATAVSDLVKGTSTAPTLLLARNGISSMGADSLSDALAASHSVTTLSLFKNKIGDEGLTSLADALVPNRMLATLNVRDNRITSVGARALASVMQQLGDACGLELLNISDNPIGPQGCTALAYPLCRLHTLNMSNCQIGDNLAPLAVLLKSSRGASSLTTLKLANNNIGDSGASHLAASLLHNYTLKSLDLSSNNIQAAGARKLADMRRLNTSLESLNMNASGCPCGRSQGSALPTFDATRPW